MSPGAQRYIKRTPGDLPAHTSLVALLFPWHSSGVYSGQDPGNSEKEERKPLDPLRFQLSVAPESDGLPGRDRLSQESLLSLSKSSESCPDMEKLAPHCSTSRKRWCLKTHQRDGRSSCCKLDPKSRSAQPAKALRLTSSKSRHERGIVT